LYDNKSNDFSVKSVRFDKEYLNPHQKNEGKMMKLNSIKLFLALIFSILVLTGCESLSTEDEFTADEVPAAQDENQSEDSASTGGTVSGAPDADQISVEEQAAQRAKEAAMAEQAALREMRTFYFEFDQSTVKSESRPALAAHAAYLSANPSSKVVIEGHCDERGTKGYNVALGERRGNSIAKFLIVNGVSKAQIEVVSYGEERPANAGHNEAAWAQNRRAYIEYQ
jgi:peptidoglycan-associated lipoprotein